MTLKRDGFSVKVFPRELELTWYKSAKRDQLLIKVKVV